MAGMDWPLKFGIFLAPFHPAGQNPTVALERDIELIQHLDRLGFDEAWIGEHHSGGWEIITSPEIFIASAAARTKRITFGTGVVSLPYHHPLMTADRIIMLDHLTRGRIIFGVGPGALPSDAHMLGIDPATQRQRMDEGLEAILALFRSTEPVTRETDWFTLRDARLNIGPYSHPHPEVAVAAMISPSGPTAAGRHGTALLSIGTTQKSGIDLLGQHWSVLEDEAAVAGHVPDRESWRVLGQFHIAETREQAYQDVDFGIADFSRYFSEVAALPIFPGAEPEGLADYVNQSGAGVIGTPDDAIEHIENVIKSSDGGFGTLLGFAHEWANREATNRSYELFARYVIPHFQNSAKRALQSEEWVSQNRPTFMGQFGQAITGAVQKHADDKAARE
jgi:limonene 1,2-monooxygenase